MSKLIIGSHINVSEPDMLLGAVKTALSYGENTFMFYTGAPQNTLRKPISQFKVKEARALMAENGIDIDNVVVHAPYIINLANVKDERKFPVTFLQDEIKRVAEIGCKYLVFHPGSHVGKGVEVGLKEEVDNLNLALANDNSNVIILIETMSGKGNELGRNITEIKYLLDNVVKKDRFGVCLDTCHICDSGIEAKDFDQYLVDFDTQIGLEKVHVIHINDSMNPCGSHKDRHENIGFGTLGFDNLINIIYNPRLDGVIKILETPYVNGIAPYKKEIEMIRNKKFNPNLKEELKAEAL